LVEKQNGRRKKANALRRDGRGGGENRHAHPKRKRKKTHPAREHRAKKGDNSFQEEAVVVLPKIKPCPRKPVQRKGKIVSGAEKKRKELFPKEQLVIRKKLGTGEGGAYPSSEMRKNCGVPCVSWGEGTKKKKTLNENNAEKKVSKTTD